MIVCYCKLSQLNHPPLIVPLFRLPYPFIFSASSPQQLHANAAGLLSGAGFRSRSTPPRIHRSCYERLPPQSTRFFTGAYLFKI